MWKQNTGDGNLVVIFVPFQRLNVTVHPNKVARIYEMEKIRVTSTRWGWYAVENTNVWKWQVILNISFLILWINMSMKTKIVESILVARSRLYHSK